MQIFLAFDSITLAGTAEKGVQHYITYSISKGYFCLHNTILPAISKTAGEQCVEEAC